MATYKITGPLRVVGQEPGSILTDEDLADGDVAWLEEVGHITPTEAAPADAPEAAPAESTQAAPADTNQEA